MNDDLRHFRAVVEEYREHPELPRFAGVLSITAIVMLLITNFTLAHMASTNADPRGAATARHSGAGSDHGGSATPAESAPNWSDILVACMNGGAFFFEDIDHNDVAVRCKVENLGRVVSLARAK